MAKRQTRRAVSLNRDVYVAASKHAFRSGKTLSQLTTEAYRALGVDIPDTHHTPVEVAAKAMAHKRPIVGIATPNGKLEVRLVHSFLRVKRAGPIRKALGDAHADACGEPHWHENVRSAG